MMLKGLQYFRGRDVYPCKVGGYCTICDVPCFEVMAMYGEGERLPGEPKQIGPPLEGAVRITFLLFDGTKTSLTFCGDCSADIPPSEYNEIWQKNIRSWMRELSFKAAVDRNPPWFKGQFSNGLLCEMGRELWTEAVKRV